MGNPTNISSVFEWEKNKGTKIQEVAKLDFTS